MDAITVQRVISVVPERTLRSQTGSLFAPAGSERAELLARFLHWLGPLEPVSKEEQQALGLRPGGKALLESEEEADEPQLTAPEAGTQIAA
jgi:hypothetical protein